MYSNFGAQKSPSRGIHFTFLTPLDQSKFEQLFLQSAASFGGNKVGAQAVSDLLRQSNLDQASLAKIWDLSCISKSSFMTFPEFVTAMFLTSQKLIGQELPSVLPLSMSEEIKAAMNRIASTESIQQLSQQFNHTHIQPPLAQSPMMTGIAPQVAMGTTHLQNLQRMSPIVPQTTIHTGYMYNTPMHTPPMHTPPMQTNGLQHVDFSRQMMPNQNGAVDQFKPSMGTSHLDQSSWKISPQESQRYHEIFHAWEQSGFMSGEIAKDVLTQSRLAPETLMAIWNLADSENRGSLDVDEFCIAMHLIYRKLNGFDVPEVLPSELKRSSRGDQKRDRVRYDQHNDIDTAENLCRQIDQEKRLLDHMGVPRSKSSISTKFTVEELQEKIKKLHVEHIQLLEENPAAVRYDEDSRVLLNLMETQRKLQEEIQYICHHEIPVLASQLRGAAAELKEAKSRQDNRTPDYLDWIQPTGPDGSVTESDRVRAKARAMMAARKVGNFGVNSGYVLRRAEEEKQEANRIADTIERETEHSKINLLDMRSDLRYLEQMTAHLDDKKRFEVSRQDLPFELRRFIQELSPIDLPRASCSTTTFNKSPSPISSSTTTTTTTTSFRPSPVPNIAETRPRTAEDIKKEAELRVQERLAALQAKRNPGGLPMGNVRMSISKPDDAEIDVEERNRIEKENKERRQQEELEEEKAFEERRRKRLEKEEADRQARYEAIQRAEEEEEERKRAEQSQSSQKAVSMTDTKPVHTNSPPLTVAPLSTTTHDIQQPSTTIDTSNPYTKLQQPSVNTLQAEKPKERTDKRESYNPFASFSAFSATKIGSSDSDSDGWSDNDEEESEDEDEFPAAGSAKTMAGKLSSVLNQMHGVSSPVPSPSTPKSSTQDITSPSIAPNAPTVPPPPSNQGPISTPIPSSGNTRNALLDQIQLGKKLKKTVTNDRSSSSVAGQVLN